ncbi:MAG: hypothetical protein AAGA95_06000 [Pseudomonadota bacterium]
MSDVIGLPTYYGETTGRPRWFREGNRCYDQRDTVETSLRPEDLDGARKDHLQLNATMVRDLGFPADLAMQVATGEIQPSSAYAESFGYLGARSRRHPDAKPVLILCGKPGLGKTVGALAAHVHHPDAGLPAFVRATDLLEMWKRGNAYAETEPVNPLIARHLIVDDLGCERGDWHDRKLASEEFVNGLERFVEHRAAMEPQSSVIITSNLAADEFGARYGGRVIRRINQYADAFTVLGEPLCRQDGGFA